MPTKANPYTGRVKLVVFDWAGTTVDFGSCSPVQAFVATLAKFGLAVTEEEVRRFMGVHKREHIKQLMALPHVADQWQTARGQAWTEADVDAVFAQYLPTQLEVLPQYSVLIPGVRQVVDGLRAQGLKLAGTTGYTRPMLDIVAAEAAKQGYETDLNLTSDEVPAGRPAPWMMYRAAEQLGVYPMAAVVKVGDTPTDIEEGQNAGAWTVAVTGTGNAVGCAYEDFQTLSPDEQTARLEAAYASLLQAGPDYLIRDFSQLPQTLAAINARLQAGEQP